MFQHTYPEVQDNGTLPIYGQTLTINGVPLQKLRLRQLRDIARAWNIQINMDAVKEAILPALTAAANNGTFRKKPDSDYYWRRAHRTGDEQDDFDHPLYEAAPPQPEASPEPDDMIKYDHIAYAVLGAAAKKIEPGLKMFGVKRIALANIIEDYLSANTDTALAHEVRAMLED